MEAKETFFFSEPCPYLPGRVSTAELRRENEYFASYEALLLLGWRRSGDILYRNRCSGCSSCIPIRISASRLSCGTRIKNLLRRNSDIRVSIKEPHFNTEYFSLYEKYIRVRHSKAESSGRECEESFLCLLNAPIAVLSEYRDLSGKLCALGFLDVLPSGLSSVYFAFDPDESRRSMGSYSVYAESSIVRAMGKLYYYLGFWVPHAPKMDYKADFHPFELSLPSHYHASHYNASSDFQSHDQAIENQMSEPNESRSWVDFSSKDEALAYISALRHR
jgi:leucyl-tRNA---protein transferase